MKRYLANFNLNIGRWFVVVGVVCMNSALMNLFNMLENDVILTAIYGCHMGHTYEFIGPHNCTEYVSITVCPPLFGSPARMLQGLRTLYYVN